MTDSQFTQVVVEDLVGETPSTVVLRLRNASGASLPSFDPGAHVEVGLPNGLKRRYSLCSDPGDLNAYEIAVLREPKSRGGSAYIHDALDIDDVMLISRPHCSFPIVAEASHHVMVAGGIGITPFVSMIAFMERSDASYELHYLARSAADAAFLSRIQDISGPRLTTYFSVEGRRFEAARCLADAARPGAQLYCCGPVRLMDDLRDRALAAGLRPRFESFVETPQAMTYGDAFEVQIASTGEVIPIEEQDTLLGALRKANCDVAWSCEHGTCGTCVIGYRSGNVIHRDGVLSPELRATHLAICVSRAKGRVTLDL